MIAQMIADCRLLLPSCATTIESEIRMLTMRMKVSDGRRLPR